MKIIPVLLIAMLFASCAFTQNRPQSYPALVAKADSFYKAKNYKSSAFTYSAAFKANGWTGSRNDRYNAACSWALANYPDSAFHNLEIIVNKAGYYNYDHITIDTDLASLHNDERWQPLLAIVMQNEEKAEATMNKPLMAELKGILKDDQGPRMRIDSVSKAYGYESIQMKRLWGEMRQKDSVDLIKIKTILDKYGWVGPDVVGNSGTLTLFLVIQHSDQQTQEKYLPAMRGAVKNGKADPAQLALLEDRVALEEGKKQIYGSQIGRDAKTGKFYISPIEDEINVDKRRAAVGLQPLKDYVQQWGIDYVPPVK